MKLVPGFIFAGVVVGLLLAIAYNTSANVAALEGGRRHLSFTAMLIYGAGGGLLAGLLLAFLVAIGRIIVDR